MSRLARKGLIARVRPGLYLVPPRLPPGGRWSPGEFLALSTLMNDRGGRYQVSGPSTFYRYGWTDQVPNRLYAYNNRISGDRQIGPVAMTLIKVADDRLGGTEVVRTPDGIDVIYASKARSLVDAVYDWSRFGSLPQAFDWIRREVKKDDAFAAELVRTTIQFGNQGTIRRMGRCSKTRRSRSISSGGSRGKSTHPRASSHGFRTETSGEGRANDGGWSSTMSDKPAGRWYHEDPLRFRDAPAFTEAESGFSSRLIEKDYYCSLLLHDLLVLFQQGLVFKGGTCLSKVHAEFFRPERRPGFLRLRPAGCDAVRPSPGGLTDQGPLRRGPGPPPLVRGNRVACGAQQVAAIYRTIHLPIGGDGRTRGHQDRGLAARREPIADRDAPGA